MARSLCEAAPSRTARMRTTLVAMSAHSALAVDIVHDAEYYILEAQNGKVWAVEDQGLDQKLAELKKKFRTPPNIDATGCRGYRTDPVSCVVQLAGRRVAR